MRRAALRRRQLDELGARVAERHGVLVRQLARDPAHRQAEPHVGRDRDVEDRVSETDDRTGVLTDLAAARRQHDDAVVVLPEAELALGADHAVGDVAVGLARRDLEAAREDRAGQGHHDEVALDEVARTADDAPHARGVRVPVGGAHVDLAPADRLLELGELLDRAHVPDDERAGHVGAEVLDLLELEPDGHEAVADRLGRLGLRQVDVVPHPGQRDAHQTSMPNCVVKRMSPSTISRMSVTSWRNISVRSMPMPKAKPE